VKEFALGALIGPAIMSCFIVATIVALALHGIVFPV
jgi:hypothetical protein